METHSLVPTAPSTAITSAPTSSSSLGPSRVLPLAASLESNLHLLLARLGKLLNYQAMLRTKISGGGGINSTTSPLQLGLLPGLTQLTTAAQKWQHDVQALNDWVNEAQDALLIELARATKREAVQAEEAAKKAEIESAAQKAKQDLEEEEAQRLHNTAEEAQRLQNTAEEAQIAVTAALADAGTGADAIAGSATHGQPQAPISATSAPTRPAQTSLAATPAGAPGIIDFTDDDEVELSNKRSDGKHARDDGKGTSNDRSADQGNSKRQKMEGTVNESFPVLPSSTTVGTSIADPPTLLTTLAHQTSQNDDSQSKEGIPAMGHSDFSALANAPDLFNLSSFIGGVGEQGLGNGQDGSTAGPIAAAIGQGQGQELNVGGEKNDSGIVTMEPSLSNQSDPFGSNDMGGDGLNFNFDPNNFGMDAMGSNTGIDFGSGVQGNGSDMGGIDFNAALEGVDWSSLMDMIGQGGT